MSLNPWEIFAHICAVLVLFVVLRMILVKPVGKFLKQRQDKIDAALAQAKETEEKNRMVSADGERARAAAQTQIDELLTQARKQAELEAQAIVAQAKEDARELIARARQEAQVQHEQMLKNLQSETADLAVEIASRVLNREVRAQDHQAMILQFLEKVG